MHAYASIIQVHYAHDWLLLTPNFYFTYAYDIIYMNAVDISCVQFVDISPAVWLPYYLQNEWVDVDSDSSKSRRKTRMACL